MCKVISICNQKGGVGKTTTTVSLGIGLAKQGKKVLLIDLDSQANLTMSLGFEPDELDNTVVDLINKSIEDTPIEKERYTLTTEGVDLIPSDIRLSSTENILINVMGRERILQNALEPYLNDYDYILIDCMPSLNVVTINALVVADSVLIPVQSHYLSARGLELLLDTINKVKRQMNSKLTIEGILLTMFDKRTTFAKNLVKSIKDNYGENIKVFDTIIPVSVKAVETTAMGKSIFTHDSKSVIATAYQSFAEEVASHG